MNKKIVSYLIFSCLASAPVNSMENLAFNKYYVCGQECPTHMGRFTRKFEQHMCWLLSNLYFRMRPDLVAEYDAYSKKLLGEIITECDKYADEIFKNEQILEYLDINPGIFGAKTVKFNENLPKFKLPNELNITMLNYLNFLRSLYASMIKTVSLMFYNILKKNESFDVLDGKFNDPSIINLTPLELHKISNLVGIPIIPIEGFGLFASPFRFDYPCLPEKFRDKSNMQITDYRSACSFESVGSFWGLTPKDNATLFICPLLYPMSKGSLILQNINNIQNKINEDGIIRINGKNYKCISVLSENEFGGGHGFCYQIKYNENGKYAGCILRSSSYYPDANLPDGKFTDIFTRKTHKNAKTGRELNETVKYFHLLDNEIYEKNKEFYCYKD